MNVRGMLITILALGSGLSAVVGVRQFQGNGRAQAAPETTQVVLAAAEIARGRMLEPKDLKVVDWPKAMVPAGAVANIDTAAGRSAVSAIAAGQTVLESNLAPKDAGRGLAALIPPGMRAYTIQASRAAASVAGFILPGNKVDVLLNLRDATSGETGGGSTTTLLQSVEILAVDQRLDAPADNKVDPKGLGSVTLLVNPQQAALLDLGQNMGQLSLALRNIEDHVAANTMPATLADIRFRQDKSMATGILKRLAESLTSKQSSPREEPPHQRIVTLRGSVPGTVWITKEGH